MEPRGLIAALRQRREELGLSRRALSLRLGYGEETVRHWEDGQNNPSWNSLHCWAESLGMKLRLVKESVDELE